MQDANQMGGPPPAYLLESEDEDDLLIDYDDLSPADRAATSAKRSAAAKILAPDSVIQIVGMQDVSKGNNLIFLVGQAGETLTRELMRPDSDQQTDGLVLVDGAKIATFRSYPSTTPKAPTATLIFLSVSIPLASLYPLTTTLIDSFAPASSTIIAPYHFSTYITSYPMTTPKLLYLRSTPNPLLDTLAKNDIIRPFSTPNLIHGLAASLLTSSISSTPPIQSLLLLLPSTAPPALSPSLSSYSHALSSEAEENLFDQIEDNLRTVAKELGWGSWALRTRGEKKRGNAFEWLEKARRERRREEVGSMYI